MKRFIYILLIAFFPFYYTYAQLTVHNNGYLSILTDESPLSPISINGRGSLNYLFSCTAQNKGAMSCIVIADSISNVYGIRSIINTTSNSINSIGIRGEAGAITGPMSYRTIGVMGLAENSQRSIGVFGRVQTGTRGAAIYGTTQNDYGSISDTHLYAGYFRGDTRVTGDLTVNGNIHGVLLGETSESLSPIESESQMSKENSSIISKISTIPVFTGKLNYTPVKTSKLDKYSSEILLDDEICAQDDVIELGTIEKQYIEKEHHVVSVEDLKKVFPELVYEKEDGNYGINYIEMIPLLLKSINELNYRIVELEKTGEEMRSRSSYKSAVQGNLLSAAKLFQNTPNPFNESTKISFILPENTTNAYIGIFDMTGKMLKKIAISPEETSVSINGWELGEGMFLYTLMVDGRDIDTKRMLISK